MQTKGLKPALIFSCTHLIIRVKSLINCCPYNRRLWSSFCNNITVNFWIKFPAMLLFKSLWWRFMDISDLEDWLLSLFFFFIFITRVCDFRFETRHFHGKGTNPVFSIYLWGSPTLPSLFLISAFFKIELEVYVSLCQPIKFCCLTTFRGEVTWPGRPVYCLPVSPTKQLKKQLQITFLAQILRGESNKIPEVWFKLFFFF